MTLATKNGSLIVKDGRLAENCGCCGGWWCYLDPSETCCGTFGSLILQMNFSASPQLGDPAFGATVQQGFVNQFPKQVTNTVSLTRVATHPIGAVARFVAATASFNALGLGESEFRATVDISQSAACDYTVKVSTLFLTWKWRKDSQQLSQGDPAVEPSGYQYGELVFQDEAIGITDSNKIMSFSYSVSPAGGLQSTQLTATGKTIAGRGSATGTITITPQS
jgi:hypothetical protein